jgi:glycosyltransferase involved in cell wall biosynthesis
VVEAIAAGTPVVCNNVGGTPELVGPAGGLICAVDAAYDMKPVKLYSPPAINRELVAQALRRCVEDPPVVRSETLDIRSIARQYLDFFEVVHAR